MKNLAYVVSYIFHPLWMPIMVFLTIHRVDTQLHMNEAIFKFLLILLVINVLAPAISIFVMAKRKMISSIEVEGRGERTAPFMIVIFYYIMSYVLLRMKGVPLPQEIYALIFCLIAALIISLLINTRFKISQHLMAQGAFVGILTALSIQHSLKLGFLVSVAILIAGIVGWARLTIGIHKPKEVYSGFLLGFIILFIGISVPIYL